MSGGTINTARGDYSSVTGGQNNNANAHYSNIVGGQALTTTTEKSVIGRPGTNPTPPPASQDPAWVSEIKAHYMDRFGFVSDRNLDEIGSDGKLRRVTGDWNKGNALVWTSLYYIARKLRGEWDGTALASFNQTVRLCLYNQDRPGLLMRHPEDWNFTDQDDYTAVAVASHIVDPDATLAKDIYSWGLYGQIPTFSYGWIPESVSGLFDTNVPNWLGYHEYLQATLAMAAKDPIWLNRDFDISPSGSWQAGFILSMYLRANSPPKEGEENYYETPYLGWLMSRVVTSGQAITTPPIDAATARFLEAFEAAWPQGGMGQIFRKWWNDAAPGHPLITGLNGLY